MWRKEGESSFRVDAITSRETQCRCALHFCAPRATGRFCLGLRLRFEKVARADSLSVAHNATIDDPSLRSIFVVNLPDFWPKRPLLILLYLGLSRWLRFHGADLAAFWNFDAILRVENSLNSMRRQSRRSLAKSMRRSARDLLHSMDVSLKPGFVLHEFKISPGNFIKKRAELINSSESGEKLEGL
jgi:hypothetical protein